MKVKIKIHVLRETRPYLILLVKPSFFRFSGKILNFMRFERPNIIFFPEKKIIKQYVCLPYLKCSEQTHPQ